jgi:hypothetical protein
MYYTYYLKTTGRTDFIDKVQLTGLATLIEDNSLVPSSGINIDDIGTIYKETGSTIIIDTGEEVPELEAIEGYHFNVRSSFELSSEQLSHFTVCYPETPSRVWC